MPVTRNGSPAKACMQCNEEKSLADFPRNRNRADGRDNRCKRCTAKVVAARVARRAPVLSPQVTHKVCVRCGKEKPAAAFNRNKVRPDGLCSYCKLCNAAAAAERRKTRKPVLQPTVTHKVCSECQEDQDASAFHRSKSYNDGLYGKCKRCCAAALSRRRASGEGGDASVGGPAEYPPVLRSPQGLQHSSRGELMTQVEITNMLLETSQYGDEVAKVLAQLVAETMQQPQPPVSVAALVQSLVGSGANKDAVEAYLPSIAPQLFQAPGRVSSRRRSVRQSSDAAPSDDDDQDDSDCSWDSENSAPRRRRSMTRQPTAAGAQTARSNLRSHPESATNRGPQLTPRGMTPQRLPPPSQLRTGGEPHWQTAVQEEAARRLDVPMDHVILSEPLLSSRFAMQTAGIATSAAELPHTVQDRDGRLLRPLAQHQQEPSEFPRSRGEAGGTATPPFIPSLPSLRFGGGGSAAHPGAMAMHGDSLQQHPGLFRRDSRGRDHPEGAGRGRAAHFVDHGPQYPTGSDTPGMSAMGPRSFGPGADSMQRASGRMSLPLEGAAAAAEQAARSPADLMAKLADARAIARANVERALMGQSTNPQHLSSQEANPAAPRGFINREGLPEAPHPGGYAAPSGGAHPLVLGHAPALLLPRGLGGAGTALRPPDRAELAQSTYWGDRSRAGPDGQSKGVPSPSTTSLHKRPRPGESAAALEHFASLHTAKTPRLREATSGRRGGSPQLLRMPEAQPMVGPGAGSWGTTTDLNVEDYLSQNSTAFPHNQRPRGYHLPAGQAVHHPIPEGSMLPPVMQRPSFVTGVRAPNEPPLDNFFDSRHQQAREDPLQGAPGWPGPSPGMALSASGLPPPSNYFPSSGHISMTQHDSPALLSFGAMTSASQQFHAPFQRRSYSATELQGKGPAAGGAMMMPPPPQLFGSAGLPRPSTMPPGIWPEKTADMVMSPALGLGQSIGRSSSPSTPAREGVGQYGHRLPFRSTPDLGQSADTQGFPPPHQQQRRRRGLQDAPGSSAQQHHDATQYMTRHHGELPAVPHDPLVQPRTGDVPGDIQPLPASNMLNLNP